MTYHRNPARPIRCPRCKSKELIITEHHEQTRQYRQDDQLRLSPTTPDQREKRNHLSGRCEACHYQWRLRGPRELSFFSYIQLHDQTTAETADTDHDVSTEQLNSTQNDSTKSKILSRNLK